MTTLKDIEIDLLFRIDFFALTNRDEEGFSDDKFEREKGKYKLKYGFQSYYYRDFEYQISCPNRNLN